MGPCIIEGTGATVAAAGGGKDCVGWLLLLRPVRLVVVTVLLETVDGTEDTGGGSDCVVVELRFAFRGLSVFSVD